MGQLELVTCSSVLVTIRESGAPYLTRELSSRSEYNIKDPYFHSSYQAMKNTRFRLRRLTQLLRKVNIRLPFNQLSVFKSHFAYFFSFKPPPSLHPVFFTYNLRFGLDSEQENGTLICSEPKNGFRLRALLSTPLCKDCDS